MNDARYMRLYSIKGGIERLIDRLVSEVSAEVRLNSPVVRIGRTPRGTYRITSRWEDRLVSDEFDVVMLALPQLLVGPNRVGRRCFAPSACRSMSRTTIFLLTTFASVACLRDRSGVTS